MSTAALDKEGFLFDFISEFLRCPLWTTPVNNFIDKHSVIFTNAAENKLEYTAIHQDFMQLIEDLLEYHLAELGVSAEEFANACASGKHTRKIVFNHFLAADDFIVFKRIMVRRAQEIELETLSEIKADAAASGDTADHGDTAFAPEGGPGAVAAAAPEGAALSEAEVTALEEQQLKLALALSTKQAERERRRALDAEEAELQRAIAASLEDAGLDTARLRMEQAELEEAIALSIALEVERQEETARQATAEAASVAAAATAAPAATAPAAPKPKLPAAPAKTLTLALPPLRDRPLPQSLAGAAATAAAAEPTATAAAAASSSSLSSVTLTSTSPDALQAFSEQFDRQSAAFNAIMGGDSSAAAITPAAAAAAAAAAAPAGGLQQLTAAERAEREAFVRRHKAELIARRAAQRDRDLDAYNKAMGNLPTPAPARAPDAAPVSSPAAAAAAPAAAAPAASGDALRDRLRRDMDLTLARKAAAAAAAPAAPAPVAAEEADGRGLAALAGDIARLNEVRRELYAKAFGAAPQ